MAQRPPPPSPAMASATDRKAVVRFSAIGLVAGSSRRRSIRGGSWAASVRNNSGRSAARRREIEAPMEDAQHVGGRARTLDDRGEVSSVFPDAALRGQAFALAVTAAVVDGDAGSGEREAGTTNGHSMWSTQEPWTSTSGSPEPNSSMKMRTPLMVSMGICPRPAGIIEDWWVQGALTVRTEARLGHTCGAEAQGPKTCRHFALARPLSALRRRPSDPRAIPCTHP